MKDIKMSKGLFKDHISSFSLSPAEGEKFSSSTGGKAGEFIKKGVFDSKEKQPFYIEAIQ